MSSDHIMVTKHSGDLSPFSEEKLRNSLMKSGAPINIIDKVTSKIIDDLEQGISTRKIYQKAHQLLKKQAGTHASRYKLKQAILELGPSGYPFEQFIGELFKVQGYDVQIGVIVEGKCVNHEVDVIAENDNNRLMIECKFHNRHGYKSDVKIPLYIQSRFVDVRHSWKLELGDNKKELSGWVVTNSRFTSDAIVYAKCVGLNLLGWDFPNTQSLKSIIEQYRIQPITTLASLTKLEKEILFKEGMVLCRNLVENSDAVTTLIGKKARKILKEADYMCSYPEN